jgi:hypothetical protein
MFLFAAVPVGAVSLVAEEQSVAYEDDFATVAGQQTSNMNGFYEESSVDKTRNSFSYLDESVEGGDLVLSILEDDETNGPDGKAGVLSLSYECIPIAVEYSGFAYLGRTDEPIKLPNFQAKVGQQQLNQVKVSFYYKAVQPRKRHPGASYNCRFEPDLNHAFNYRIDFGQLNATARWQKFERSLGEGENRDQFIAAVNANPQAGFKIVWAQCGKITNYDAGDTLLIDDFKITINH